MSVPSTPPSPIAFVRHAAYEAARFAYHFPQRAMYRSTLGAIEISSNEEISVNYGVTATTPPTSGPLIGGKVKLVHLKERFPEQFSGFNLIYAVSSAPPPYLGDLVRWARKRGCRFILNQNGVAYRSWCGDYYPWFNRPLADLLRQADHIVYQSEFCRLYADRYLGNAACPTSVLFNPVDVAHFSPSSQVPDESRWELLAAGTNHHFYRVRASLDCLADLLAGGDPAHLTIAGAFIWADGEREVREYIDRRNLSAHVTIRPPFTQQQAPSIYRAAHLLLHPKYKDPCPTVPLEALACGLPVIGSRSGGMPELITPETGRLIDVSDDDDADHGPDPEAMAEAVRELMPQRAAASRAAREHAEAVFSRDRWLDAHEALFHQVLACR